MASLQQDPFIGQTCLSCHKGNYQEPSNGQEWHVTCSMCSAILFVYVPMEHQSAFHSDPHQYRLYAGGFGSAKTSTCAADIIQHVISTPRGMTLIGAATFPQLEETAKKTFMEMFPKELIDVWSEKHQRLTALNGHRVVFRPLDDEGKARSLNLTAFWIEEASEVKYEFFVQLQTRLRNTAAKHHLGLLSTNPDQNWVKTEFLLRSDVIEGGDVKYHVENPNKNFATYIAETSKNKYLPPNYEATVAEGKPDWWIRRFLKGSFENKEGLVYPQLEDNFIEPFDIPKHWPRYMALDPGINHPTAVLWAAVDEKEGKVYFYDEHYETDKPVNYHSRIINNKNKDVPQGIFRSMVGDPKGKTRTGHDLSSVFDHYADNNIYLQPAKNNIDDGIQRVYDFLDRGVLKFFKTLRTFRWEGQNYRYPERKVNDNRKDTYFDKPIDKDNHLMDTLRYIIMELPNDVKDLKNPMYQREKEMDTLRTSQSHLPFALQDEHEETIETWLHYY